MNNCEQFIRARDVVCNLSPATIFIIAVLAVLGLSSAAIVCENSSEAGSSLGFTCTATLSSVSAVPLNTPLVGGTSA
jgi:hypothetical protein